MDINYQLVPPHMHRRNAAERAIRTFKNHFISGLQHATQTFHSIFGADLSAKLRKRSTCFARPASIPNSLPTTSYLVSTISMLIHLRHPESRSLLMRSRQNELHGQHTALMAGTLVPLMNITVVTASMPQKQEPNESATPLTSFRTIFEMPKQSSADAAIRAAQELIHALKHPAPATPFQSLSNQHLQSLEQLADILLAHVRGWGESTRTKTQRDNSRQQPRTRSGTSRNGTGHSFPNTRSCQLRTHSTLSAQS
jgi:hypothetical protein